ncbi:MAG: DUF3450 family protein, partial [Gammaproteobacteria bacterium]
DSRRAALLTEQAELEQQQAHMKQSLNALLSQLAQITTRIPPALETSWQDEQDALGEEADITQQLQVAVAQLSHLVSFDQRVSLHEGAIRSDDGRTIQVKQLDLGTGMAWFVSSDEQAAGWGRSTESGWRWHFEKNPAAAGFNVSEISKAIAIFEKRHAAELVRLPVQLAGDVKQEVQP